MLARYSPNICPLNDTLMNRNLTSRFHMWVNYSVGIFFSKLKPTIRSVLRMNDESSSKIE